MSRWSDSDNTQPWDKEDGATCARCGAALDVDTDLCDTCRAERKRIAAQNEDVYTRAIRTWFQKTEQAS
jgi:predicted amidophosphoribosyltransferase